MDGAQEKEIRWIISPCVAIEAGFQWDFGRTEASSQILGYIALKHLFLVIFLVVLTYTWSIAEMVYFVQFICERLRLTGCLVFKLMSKQI